MNNDTTIAQPTTKQSLVGVLTLFGVVLAPVFFFASAAINLLAA